MREIRSVVAVALVAGFVVVVALGPVAYLVASSVLPAGGGVGVLADPLTQAAIANSLVQGSFGAAGAFVVGYPVGLFLARHARRSRPYVEAVLLVPFLLPSVVMAFAVRGLFGSDGTLSGPIPFLAPLGSGLPAIVVANVAYNVALVALFTAVGTAAASRDLEEAAATLGASPARAFVDVWGPRSLAGATAGALLAFLFSALAFAAPILLCGARCYTIEARIWSLDTAFLDPSGAGVLAGVAVALLALPTCLYLLLVARLRTGRPDVRGPVAGRPGPAGRAFAVVTGAVVTGLGLLLAGVLTASLRAPPGGRVGGAWTQLFDPATTRAIGLGVGVALTNTVAYATAAALLAVLLGIVGGFALAARPRRGAVLHGLVLGPLLLSPVVLALALTAAYPSVATPTGVWLLVILAQAALALPFALQSLFVPLASRGAAPREAAAVLGAAPWRAYLDADVAAMGPALRGAALFAFALGLGEFAATFFLTSLGAPAFGTLPVLLYDLQSPSLRAFPAATALAALLVLVNFVLLALVARGGRRVDL